jgi:hypothetical protein
MTAPYMQPEYLLSIRAVARVRWVGAIQSAQFVRYSGETPEDRGKGNYLCRKFVSNAEVVSSKSCCNAAMELRYFIANAPMATNIIG